ncbi:LysM peptidoglycan-binding domain-containing protein [Viridibacillus sp. YIM B01967]|uniref:LysM peptidoglycan-binding domain-containing protein n=1 Tax=Viridibacillus soli TaxID=2798301 RepID=A0ABS1HD42_9BACL|nr:LysM peptidoglycan-binding domain-containing protein [Viridibacillus soli]MBK3497256.1 LysM peptidoglycan-binding domain-containing protein [Viridibacillus soli]
MAQEDYREKIEEHRQTIKLKLDSENNENPSRMTRSQLRGSKKKKKKRRINPLPTILAVIFISIPVSILIYVGFFYDKSKNEETELEKAHVRFETNKKANTADKSDDKKGKETTKEDTAKKEKASVPKKEDNKTIKEPPVNNKVNTPNDNAVANEPTSPTPQEAYQQAQANDRLHTVQTGDTLYNITMKYYGSMDGMAKIKYANGMTSDNVIVGTRLAIPQ